MMPICWLVAGYSGSHAEVVGSVLVSNLKTGIRKGGWDRAEVRLICTCNLFNLGFFLITEIEIFNPYMVNSSLILHYFALYGWSHRIS